MAGTTLIFIKCIHVLAISTIFFILSRFHLFLQVLLWFFCISKSQGSICTFLLYRHSVPLSVCLTANLSFLFDRPCLLSSTITATLRPSALSLVPTSLSPLQNISFPISLHIIFSCLQRNRDSWLSFILLIHGVAEANLQGTRQRLFVKLLFISFIKSSSSPIKEPRIVALDSHITLVSFGVMIYCLI